MAKGAPPAWPRQGLRPRRGTVSVDRAPTKGPRHAMLACAPRRAPAARPPRTRKPLPPLLDLDDGALVLELLLDLGGLFLGDAFLDHLAAGLDQLLGLLDAEARDDGADLLDNVELLVAARL